MKALAVEESGKTVDEAVDKALSSLGIKRDNAIIEVLSEPAQGLLSFIGSKNARVSVQVRCEPAEYLKNFFKEILGFMNIIATVSVLDEEDKLSIDIEGKKSAILIGRRGKTLNELQYLANAVLRRQFEGLNKMVIVDVEGYRIRRETTLKQLAASIARKVSSAGREQILEPMTPQERRIIHMALQDHEDVVTYSKGDEPYRKVVISPR
jgi:spoIIIJ-associated protein